MEATIEAIQNIVTTEPDTVEQPGTAQPDNDATETRLAEEISELWSSHVRLSGDRKFTSKELHLIRTRLAQRLYEMKALLAHPGRGGEWRGWLRERGIPRSTADRLANRYAETLGSASDANALSESIPGSPDDSAEKLANTVWQRFRKVLATDDAVVRFIGRIAEISGVGHEQRTEGLVIFHAAPKADDGMSGTRVSDEATSLVRCLVKAMGIGWTPQQRTCLRSFWMKSLP